MINREDYSNLIIAESMEITEQLYPNRSKLKLISPRFRERAAERFEIPAVVLS